MTPEFTRRPHPRVRCEPHRRRRAAPRHGPSPLHLLERASEMCGACAHTWVLTSPSAPNVHRRLLNTAPPSFQLLRIHARAYLSVRGAEKNLVGNPASCAGCTRCALDNNSRFGATPAPLRRPWPRSPRCRCSSLPSRSLTASTVRARRGPCSSRPSLCWPRCPCRPSSARRGICRRRGP